MIEAVYYANWSKTNKTDQNDQNDQDYKIEESCIKKYNCWL